MHYRQIKRICRGESSKDNLFLTDYKRDIADMVIPLKQNIVDVVYLNNVSHTHSYIECICIPQQKDPIFWFVRCKDSVYYAVGIRLIVLMRILLSSECNPYKIGSVKVMTIIRTFIHYAKWNLKQQGIKFGDKNFAINRRLNDYTLANRPQEAYSYLNGIFINYLTLMTKWIKV